jgi:membrane-bound metal-dependent hydrolase YbcI (DUF457 family)
VPSPAIHIMGGALVYLLSGNLSLDRLYIIGGVVLLSVLPDFDLFFPGPHHGFTHSLIFCILTGAIIGYLSKFSYLSVFSILFSHVLLDSLGNGFGQVSWLWPFFVHHSPVTYGLNDIGEFIKNTFRIL